MPVVFAIDSSQALSDDDARDLAEQLGLRRNLVASKLAGRILNSLARDAELIVLTPAELREIADVFAEAPRLLDMAGFAQLNEAVTAALEHE